MTILGVSPDLPAAQKAFRQKFAFPFRLLCDTEHTLAEAYGAWVLKTVFGKEGYGIDRSTFLVDAEGVIREIWRQVQVDGHAGAVLLAAKGLA